MDASVHGDEAVDVWLVLDTWVVETGVQHDDGVGQDVGRVRVVQDTTGITFQVVGGKDLHDAVNLLCLSWEVKTPEECSGRDEKEAEREKERGKEWEMV